MPKILIVATCPWFSAARLAAEFARAGCEVEAVCPRRHALTVLRGLARVHVLRALSPVASIRAAIDASRPDIVIPCDDPSTTYLHAIHEQSIDEDGEAGERALIERSLGKPSGFQATTRRSALMAVARDLGILVPETAVVRTQDELGAWLRQNGFPAVLKVDRSYGGRGVGTLRSFADVEAVWNRVSSCSLLKAVKRAVVNRDANDVLRSLARERPEITVQRFVSGSDATAAVACWKGEVLATISADVVCTTEPHGPSSVVRIVDNAQIEGAARTIAGALGLSGLFGLDFIVEAETGRAWLLEMNPRATQMAHLRLGKGRDLPAALCGAFSQTAVDELNVLGGLDTIALFPQEWVRDSGSVFLQSAYHDVPWDQPALVRACLSENVEYAVWSAIHSTFGNGDPARRRAAAALVEPLPPR